MSDAKVNMIIPFDEVVPGATVRFTKINGRYYLSVKDIIRHVCNKNSNDAGEVWRKLSIDLKADVKDCVSLASSSSVVGNQNSL